MREQALSNSMPSPIVHYDKSNLNIWQPEYPEKKLWETSLVPLSTEAGAGVFSAFLRREQFQDTPEVRLVNTLPEQGRTFNQTTCSSFLLGMAISYLECMKQEGQKFWLDLLAQE